MNKTREQVYNQVMDQNSRIRFPTIIAWYDTPQIYSCINNQIHEQVKNQTHNQVYVQVANQIEAQLLE